MTSPAYSDCCRRCGRLRPPAALQRDPAGIPTEKMCRGRKACDAEIVHTAVKNHIRKAMSGGAR